VLRIGLLGEIEVVREGKRLTLPPSRKTRALLAYLVATGRRHRRERLCSLFWEVPDDPRGALRWSLSRLRALIDDRDAHRILADRETVAFEAFGAGIDLLALRRDAKRLEELPIDALERLVGSFRGEFLEGLDLHDLPDFQAWCVAEREDVRRLQSQALSALASRLAEQPEAALPHVRMLVHVDPLSASARRHLLRHLVILGRRAEAEQQYEAALRQLREVGEDEALTAAWRDMQGQRIPPRSEPADIAAPAVAVDARSRLDHGGKSPLVGRQTELSRLVAAFSASADGPGAMLIAGEPGLGKTRLVDEAVAIARQHGFGIVRGRGREADRSRPYGVWRESLEGFSIPDLRGDEADQEDAARERYLADAARGLIDAAGGDGPILAVVDDVHWCDAASTDLIQALFRAARERPLSAILTARSGELADNQAVLQMLRGLRHDRMLDEIRLGPLAPADVDALVRWVSPGEDTARIVGECGGNPLFAIELARQPRAEGDALPRSLRELIRDRVDRLPHEAANALRWASVIGHSFATNRLLAVADMPIDDLAAVLGVLERHDFIAATSEGGDYAFVHDLVHRAVYTALSEPRRRLMHLKVARALRDLGGGIENLADEIAHHAVRGGDSAMAAAACVEAGERCLRLYANVEAAGFAHQGLRHADALPEPDRVKRKIDLTRLAMLAEKPRDVTAVAARFENLAEVALAQGCPEHARLAFHALSFLRWERGDWRDAERNTLRAELVSRTAEDSSRVLAMAETARCLVMIERDLGQAHVLLGEASNLAARLGIEPNAIPDTAGMLRLHRGDYEAAMPSFRRARLLAQRDGDRIGEFLALEHMAEAALSRKVYAEAGDVAAEMARLAVGLGSGSEGPFAAALAALCRMAEGDEAADAILDDALDVLRTVDAKHRLALCLRWSAEIDIAAGRFARALRRAEQSLALATAINRPSDIALARVAIAAARHAAGDPAQAAAA
jgi:DNA-binding SARP family transcriptional activator